MKYRYYRSRSWTATWGKRTSKGAKEDGSMTVYMYENVTVKPISLHANQQHDF